MMVSKRRGEWGRRSCKDEKQKGGEYIETISTMVPRKKWKLLPSVQPMEELDTTKDYCNE